MMATKVKQDPTGIGAISAERSFLLLKRKDVNDLGHNDRRAIQPKAKKLCTTCKNHGFHVPVQGHKRTCPYLNCPCRHCCQTRQRRAMMREQVKVSRDQKKLARAERLKRLGVSEEDVKKCMSTLKESLKAYAAADESGLESFLKVADALAPVDATSVKPNGAHTKYQSVLNSLGTAQRLLQYKDCFQLATKLLSGQEMPELAVETGKLPDLWKDPEISKSDGVSVGRLPGANMTCDEVIHSNCVTSTAANQNSFAGIPLGLNGSTPGCLSGLGPPSPLTPPEHDQPTAVEGIFSWLKPDLPSYHCKLSMYETNSPLLQNTQLCLDSHSICLQSTQPSNLLTFQMAPVIQDNKVSETNIMNHLPSLTPSYNRLAPQGCPDSMLNEGASPDLGSCLLPPLPPTSDGGLSGQLPIHMTAVEEELTKGGMLFSHLCHTGFPSYQSVWNPANSSTGAFPPRHTTNLTQSISS